MAQTPKMVVVEWDDAWGDSKIAEPGDDRFQSGYRGFQTGFLKSADEKFVVVCREWWPGHPSDTKDKAHYQFCVSIPRSLVKSVTTLRKAGKL